MPTNADLFFEALVHTEHRLCGLRLKPLCLLHLLWLQQIDSPLLHGDRKVSMRDLELAAAICSSQSSEEITKKLESPARLWHWRNTFRSTADEARAWIAFYEDYFSLPELLTKDGQKECPLPWLATYLAAVVKETGWRADEVLVLPFGFLFWLNASFGYLSSGESNVVSDKERQAMALLNDMGAGR